MKPLLIVAGPLAALLALGACATPEEDLAEARGMSCTELAREIGRAEQERDDARLDGDLSTLDALFSESDSEIDDAILGGTLDDLAAESSEREVQDLTRIFRQKGCR